MTGPQEIVRLREEEGLSFSEIGKRLGITKNAAIGRYDRQARGKNPERKKPRGAYERRA